jgi:hypothetical protein
MLVTSRDSESWRRPAAITSSLEWFSTIAERLSPSAERLVAAPISRLWGCLDFRDLRAQDEGAIRSENAIDPLWAAATFVIDVVGRAGRIVAGVNGEDGIGLVAESIVRLLYENTFAVEFRRHHTVATVSHRIWVGWSGKTATAILRQNRRIRAQCASVTRLTDLKSGSAKQPETACIRIRPAHFRSRPGFAVAAPG